MTNASLESLQRWMQAVVVHEGGVREGVESKAAREALEVEFGELESVVLPSKQLTAAERVAIYSESYRMRLIECLQSDFAALEYVLGAERFHKLCNGYISAHPSTHFSLNQFGVALADYIESTKVKNKSFYAELARLERAMQDVFDETAAKPLAANELQSVPPERWSELRLVTSPALRLLEFRFPINRFFQAFRDGAKPSIPKPEASWCVVYRKEYAIWRANLSREQHALFAALMKGYSLGRALEICSEMHGVDLERVANSLAAWFGEWSAEGLFVGMTT